MTTYSSALALARFGFGAKPGELATVGSDGRDYLLQCLRRPPAVPASLTALKPAAEVIGLFQKLRREKKDLASLNAARPDPELQLTKDQLHEAYTDAGFARAQIAIDSDNSFYERLVAFWSNHFTVSVRGKAQCAGLVGPFERDAIRPHVLGRFEDMLLAVMHHQAMLIYLDNQVSIGPNSFAGQRRDRGLNENLAREAMELHTISVNGGYTQDDVIALAKMLTGWTIAQANEPNAGNFTFNPRFHEPGAKSLLGRRFAEDGEGEATAAFKMLAAHPSTANFVATKLARHFIADVPSPALVQKLAAVYRDSGGDLREITAALVRAPEAAVPPQKLKTPLDLVVSTFRSIGGYQGEKQKLLVAQGVLDQAPFNAPSPAGWPDQASAWAGPEAMMRRLELLHNVAAKTLPTLGDAPDAVLSRANLVLGDLLSADTLTGLRHAPSQVDALALLWASPEFQRR